jgi:hypothetical protein
VENRLGGRKLCWASYGWRDIEDALVKCFFVYGLGCLECVMIHSGLMDDACESLLRNEIRIVTTPAKCITSSGDGEQAPKQDVLLCF